MSWDELSLASAPRRAQVEMGSVASTPSVWVALLGGTRQRSRMTIRMSDFEASLARYQLGQPGVLAVPGIANTAAVR